MITERFQAAGDWSLRLDSPSKTIRDRLDWFGYLIVTPARVDPHSVDVPSLLTLSTYTGVHTGKTDRHNTINGYGPAYLLGTTEGLSWLFEADSTTADNTVTDHINNRVLRRSPGNTLNGITRGNITASATTDTLAIDAGASPLDVLNAIADTFNVWWRINPDLTLDVHTSSTLFADGQIILTPRWGGRDPAITGFLADIDTDDDVESFTTKAVVHNEIGGVYSSTSTAIYTMADGTDLIRSRYVPTIANSTNGGNRAAHNVLTRYHQQRRQITAKFYAYDFGRYARPGDRVYVYDPDINLVGDTHEVYYRGMTMNPILTRIYTVHRPIQEGMGVYLLVGDKDDPDDLVDLSDSFIPETNETSVEVGAPRRILKVV